MLSRRPSVVLSGLVEEVATESSRGVLYRADTTVAMEQVGQR